jgi:pSer/pThr/pTyr-binding forkhead associated (FHA) protein
MVELVGGPGAGNRFDIDRPIEVGRAEACGIRLADPSISSRHARLTPSGDGIDVEDLGSTNGTWVNGNRLEGPVHLVSGWQFTVGTTTVRVVAGSEVKAEFPTMNLDGISPTITIGAQDMPANRDTEAPAPAASGDLTDQLLQTPIWTDDMVAAAGIPIVDVPLVSLGGGIGSFVLVDHLRVAGMPVDHCKVLTNLDYPWQTYEYLTGVSQIPHSEILRSDSSSTPDNVWGFPSYAGRAIRDKKSRHHGSNALAPFWNVLTENVFLDYYTPQSGQVFRALQVEADRINYWPMVEKGLARMVRRRAGGGYFSILTPPAGTTPTKRVAYRSTYVHVCVGYPGLKFLDDLQEYRQSTGDSHRVVNAYEPHEHVYDELNQRKGGRVVVRGAGIVGSRILQRLIDDRDKVGNEVQILHLFRTYVKGPQGKSLFHRRPGGDGWAFQGFNWPKAAWTGQYRVQLEKSSDEERTKLFREWGGTTTPKRRLWLHQLHRGRQEGWYQEFVGVVEKFAPTDMGTVTTVIRSDQNDHLEVDANFVIDATGLEADIREHRLLADLLDNDGAQRNILGKLQVEPNFQVRGADSAPGRMYAAGSITLGSYYATVDSFLGLQYAALQVADDLAKLGFVKKIGVARSFNQWMRWMQKKAPT